MPCNREQRLMVGDRRNPRTIRRCPVSVEYTGRISTVNSDFFAMSP